MPDEEIHSLNGQPVMVLTHGGIPVSLGRIRVSQPLVGTAGPRVELVFETEFMACAIGIPLERISKLEASFDGNRYTHRLPEGDRVWLPGESPPGAASEKSPDSGAVIIESFPLPPESRLVGLSLTKPPVPPPTRGNQIPTKARF